MKLAGATFHIATYCLGGIMPVLLPIKQELNMKRFSSIIIAATVISLTTSPAIAADAERNDRLFDASGSSVGKVNQVADDGDVLVIYKGEVRRIQSETLSKTEGKLMTSLTKSEIRKLK